MASSGSAVFVGSGMVRVCSSYSPRLEWRDLWRNNTPQSVMATLDPGSWLEYLKALKLSSRRRDGSCQSANGANFSDPPVIYRHEDLGTDVMEWAW